jgi:predicted transcriptional regulator
MARFERKFTDTDFLNVLDTKVPRTVLYIMKTLPCSRNTANKYLAELEEAGKIKKLEIEGSRYDAWLKVEDKDD